MKSIFNDVRNSKKEMLFFKLSGCFIGILQASANSFRGVGIISCFLQKGLSH
jgi:hypothetical protein